MPAAPLLALAVGTVLAAAFVRGYSGFGFDVDFEVESYLRYRGSEFVNRFDANSYLFITKAMDYFDLASGFDSVASAMAEVPARFLLLTFSSDWLFPTYQTKGLVDALLALARAEAAPSADHGVSRRASTCRRGSRPCGRRRRRNRDGRWGSW